MLTHDSIAQFVTTSSVLFRGSNVLYVKPHKALRSWISNYTVSFPKAEAMSEQYTVIPHGCATLVFSCNNNTITGNIFGSITKPACVGHQANQADMLFIVEFQPAGFYAFCHIPQSDLTNLILPIDSIDIKLEQEIKSLLEKSTKLTELFSAIDTLFMHYLVDTPYTAPFLRARHMILQSNGTATVSDIAQNAYVSERQLSRLFNTYIGTGAKSFSRLVRVNKTLQLLHYNRFSLTRVGMEAGFYDNPHFIHDFTSICGITPEQYRKNMSDFYNEMAKF